MKSKVFNFSSFVLITLIVLLGTGFTVDNNSFMNSSEAEFVASGCCNSTWVCGGSTNCGSKKDCSPTYGDCQRYYGCLWFCKRRKKTTYKCTKECAHSFPNCSSTTAHRWVNGGYSSEWVSCD